MNQTNIKVFLLVIKVAQISPGISSAVIGTVKLGGAILSVPTINLIGVKKTLLLTFTGNSLSLFALGGYFYAQSSKYDVSSVYWLPLTSLALFFLFALMGSSTLPILMRGEILPRHLQGPGGASTDLICSALGLVANYVYIGLSDTRLYLAFWIYATIIVSYVVFIIFCVPETKDKTMHEVQVQLKS